MNSYIATFYTHAGALLSDRSLKQAGIESRMMPVPRKLSSSCGTCVFYNSESDNRKLMDSDLEDMYLVCDENNKITYKKL